MGNDPVWMMANNGLTFSNSVKMKLSVIMGVCHMTLGVVIKGTNLLYHRHYSHFVFEVVTGLVILLFLFGWMDLLIFLKWFYPLDIDAADQTQAAQNNGNMPSIISIMITMAFQFGTPAEDQKNFYSLVGESQDTQFAIARVLLACVMIACPLMLFAIPCCFRHGGHQVDEENELEFANINNGDDMSQPMMGGN